jgi:hypothetical protein
MEEGLNVSTKRIVKLKIQLLLVRVFGSAIALRELSCGN